MHVLACIAISESSSFLWLFAEPCFAMYCLQYRYPADTLNANGYRSGYFKGIAESRNPKDQLRPRGFPRETRLMFITIYISIHLAPSSISSSPLIQSTNLTTGNVCHQVNNGNGNKHKDTKKQWDRVVLSSLRPNGPIEDRASLSPKK